MIFMEAGYFGNNDRIPCTEAGDRMRDMVEPSSRRKRTANEKSSSASVDTLIHKGSH